jgi:hypothetical protein
MKPILWSGMIVMNGHTKDIRDTTIPNHILRDWLADQSRSVLVNLVMLLLGRGNE